MTTTTRAQYHLTTVITHWPDLQDALGTPNKIASFGIGLRAYLAALDRIDDQAAETERQRALELRALERDPAQVGERPTPLRIAILDTMQAIHTDLLECADATAEVVQRQPMGPLPAGYPEADRARRAVLAMKDRHDPRRWKWTGRRPTAPYAALWLLGRLQGVPGPFHRLDVRQTERIEVAARGAAERVERALDISVERRTLEQRHEGCGGRIEVHGGAGGAPLARCRLCGKLWAEGVVAA